MCGAVVEFKSNVSYFVGEFFCYFTHVLTIVLLIILLLLLLFDYYFVIVFLVNCSKELIQSCWIVDPRQRITIEAIINILEQNPLFIIPCLDDPIRAVDLEATGSLEMNLLPRSRNRSAHKWSVDHLLMRGLNLSSPEKGNSSEDESPDHVLSDPFDMLATDCVPYAEPRGFAAPAQHRASNGHVATDYGRRPLDALLRSSHLRRSTSTDERESIESDVLDGQRESNFGTLDVGLCVPVCSTDVDGARRYPAKMLPPSLGSRTDSDYCSQYSK